MLSLRPYQQADAMKLARLKCSACLNEQRTGKTPTALAVQDLQKNKRVLIVCPGTAMYHWKDEFERWLHRPCITLDGTAAQRKKKLEQWTDGLVVTYDTLKLINHYNPKDKDKPKKEREIISTTGEINNFLKQHIDAIIVDEFHRLRNPKTAATKALFKLIPHIEHRLALTGTPAYSKFLDIWPMLHFLYPDKFKSYWTFIREYLIVPQIWTPNGTANDLKNATVNPHTVPKLYAFLSQIATQRKQKDKDVMPWLPEKPEPQLIKLPNTAEQEKYLDSLMQYYEVEHIICKQPIDRLMRYRQICQDPRLLGLKGGSAKTNWIKQYYKDYPETPTICFSTFTSYLELLASECPLKYALITGKTTLKEREQIQQDFQAGKLQILFINIKAGKESLTLDRAERIIYLDKFPPIGDIQQSAERFTATQEDRKDIPKEIIDLVARNTFEEQIYYAILERATETDILNNFIKFAGA